jgi:hypothetical protein
MNKEKQRIAIAEACGWSLQPLIWRSEFIRYRLIKPDGKVFLFKHWDDGADECRSWETACARDVLPDYLNDLNAMHEAEKVLQQHMAKWWNYTSQLAAANSALGTGGEAHATAKQRAEAFLRTIGKWEETE